MSKQYPLIFEAGSKIEIYEDRTGKKKIGEDTLKDKRDFGCAHCPQVNDQGEYINYFAFECNPGKKIIKVVQS